MSDKPKIFMCGASDLKDFKITFEDVVNDLNCESMHYFNGTSTHSNLSDWRTNSINSVKDADIVVYVISDKYGSITWETEFATTLLEGKQFIILVRERIFDAYNDYGRQVTVNDQDSDLYKIFEILKELERQQRSPVPFKENFGAILKKEIITIFFAGLKLLNKKQGSQPIFTAIETADKEFLKDYDINKQEEAFLKKRILNKTVNKLRRKNILDFISSKSKLSDDEIIQLINEPEIAMPRKVVEELSSLISSENNIDKIFSTIIAKCLKANRDVKVERLAVNSMLSIDPEKGIAYLTKLFPVKDIGTPKRIIEYLNAQFSEFETLYKSEVNRKAAKNLAILCLNYDTSSAFLNSHYNDFISKMNNIN